MRYIFDDCKNRIDFALRNLMTFSRKNYSEKPFAPENIEEINHKFDFLKQYDISPLYRYSEINFYTNLYYLNVFDNFLSKEKESISVLDIGSKNWNYAGSEHIFFSNISTDMKLNGIELDAYRLCTNLYNRHEIAKFYIKDFSDTSYIVGDFMEHNDKYDYIVWILPFITEYPLVKWGLPLKYFKPKEMLKHAYDLLKENGELLIINQGENEYEIQKCLNKELNIPFVEYGAVEDKFNMFKNKRFCSKITKY